MSIPACLIGMLFSTGAQAAMPSDYDATIRSAYEGRQEAVAEQLAAWLAADPGNERILYDLVVVLGMAGRDDAVYLYYSRVVRADAAPYAIKAMAMSARRLGHFEEAAAAYRVLLKATPEDREAHAGLATVWMQQGRTDDALDYVITHLPHVPSAYTRYTRADLPLIVVLAELRDRRKEWLLAADAYQYALKLDPEFRYAIRGRAFALNGAGLPHLANRLAEERPDAFSLEERHRLAHDASARTIQFGAMQKDTGRGLARFATTDVGLKTNRELDDRYGTKAMTQFDRLVALRDRFHMRDAVTLYESMLKDSVPVYAKVAAADAYLYLEQPEAARDLYREAIAGGGEVPRNWQVSLLYAYSEAEQHEEAQALADKLKAETPPWVNKGVASIELPNEEFSQMALMSARLRLYAERFDEAEQQLKELRASAPFNADVRAQWAFLQVARDKPRAALEEFTSLQVDDPKSIDAAVGRGETLLALNQFEEARQVLGPLIESYPENKAVQSLARKVEYHDGLTLQIDSTLGRGGSIAGAESLIDTKLYSMPLRDSLGEPFRVFAHVSRSQGEANDGESIARTRVGTGLDYRIRDLTIEGEVNHATSNPDANGLALTMSWNLSDIWRTSFFVDTNVNDLSADAYQNGITAKTVGVSLTWVNSESRSAGVSVSRLNFSDDNTRDAARVWWNERWLSGPVFKFDTNAGFYTSRNSLTARPYFSPQSDQEASLALGAEWLTWRRYHRSFSQRITYTFGRYWQEGFGSGGVGDIRYEHAWRDDRHVALKYGVGYGFHPYDGKRETRRYGYLNLEWQFK